MLISTMSSRYDKIMKNYFVKKCDWHFMFCIGMCSDAATANQETSGVGTHVAYERM